MGFVKEKCVGDYVPSSLTPYVISFNYHVAHTYLNFEENEVRLVTF